MGELKPGWKRVKLGQVAINSTAATKDHEADGFTRYIIGKHIPEDGERIISWNSVGDAEFGSRIRTMVRTGDVICTTRGPKLKVAVAEFDCLSAHTNFILRPKDPTMFLPGILEAIVRSEGFQDHLRKHFRGSTNLFVNWSDAAEYEFALPPLAEQRRTVALLGSVRTALDAMDEAINRNEELFRSTLESLMSRGLSQSSSRRNGHFVHPASWAVLELGKVATVERGAFSHRPRNLPEFFGGPYPFVQTGDIASSTGLLTQASQSLSELGRTYSKAFPQGSILITIAAVIGATAITVADNTYCPDSVVGIIPNSKLVNVYFLEYALRRVRPYLDLQEATQTAQKNINLQVLRPLPIALPGLDEQQEIADRLRLIEKQNEALRARREMLQNISMFAMKRTDGTLA